MRLNNIKMVAWPAVCAALFFMVSSAEACTGITFRVSPDPGSVTYAFQARTMEFGADVTGWRLVSVPRGHAYASCRMNSCGGSGVMGFAWTSKYQFVGMSPARPNLPVIDEVTDGINEKGLACGGFYNVGFAQYNPKPASGKALSNTDLVSWILSNFATVKEVREALMQKMVDVTQLIVLGKNGKPLCDSSTCPQLQYAVTDESGESIVIGFADGEAKIYDSIGVVTNNPSYDWHVTNIRNYIGLQAQSRENAVFNSITFNKLGNGTGAVGLPGDFTPPSRFIRAMFFLSTAMPVKQGPDEAVARAFRILNQFDIPEGSIIATSPTGKGEIQDSTAWTSLSDLKRRRYYFHSQTDRTMRMIDLNKMPKNVFSYQELPAQELIIDVSKKFIPAPAAR